jgi:hypothetical protein
MYRQQRESQNKGVAPSNNRVDLVSAEEANQGGQEREMSVDAIPDVTELSTMVIDFIEYYDKPSTKLLRDTNYPNYLNSLFDNFNKMPMSMIKLLSEDDPDTRADNLAKIIDLLETLGKVKKGEISLEKANDDYTEKQNEAYFYPAFGGKEKLMDDIKSKGGKLE